MPPPFSWILAIGRFLYDFIVGDDWTMAGAVAVGLVLSAILNVNHIAACTQFGLHIVVEANPSALCLG
jgi:hypothetical protein